MVLSQQRTTRHQTGGNTLAERDLTRGRPSESERPARADSPSLVDGSEGASSTCDAGPLWRRVTPLAAKAKRRATPIRLKVDVAPHGRPETWSRCDSASSGVERDAADEAAASDGTSPLISVFAGPEMDRGRLRAAFLAVGIVFSPCLAYAEVMDKEPTLAALWTRALVLGLAGFFAWRHHWALGIGVSLLAGALIGSFYWELTDPYVGPAIRQEAGGGYVTQAYASMFICVALHAAGLVVLTRRRRAVRPALPPEVAGQRTTR